MTKDIVLKVVLEVPSELSNAEVKEYVRGAVTTYKGCLHPDELIRDLEVKKVVTYRRPNARG